MAGPLRLTLCGASGKMGAQVAALAAQDARFLLVARVKRSSSAQAVAAAMEAADAAVDFSAPEAAVRFAAAAAKAGTPFVTGTTGFSPAQRAKLAAAARRIPVFAAPNFSPAVAVMAKLCAEASRALARFDLAVHEVHHAEKKDAPSGTALRLAAALDRKAQVTSHRVGDVVGEHTVTFAGPFERLEIAHHAHSRALFARGALDAAVWTVGRRRGLYSMEDLVA